MVWGTIGTIGYHSRSQLFQFPGVLNSHRYTTKLYNLRSSRSFTSGAVFQQDHIGHLLNIQVFFRSRVFGFFHVLLFSRICRPLICLGLCLLYGSSGTETDKPSDKSSRMLFPSVTFRTPIVSCLNVYGISSLLLLSLLLD